MRTAIRTRKARPHGPRNPDEEGHRRAANQAIAVSAAGLAAAGLAAAGLLELALAIVTGSVALLSDALHNLSDVSTSAVVYAGFRISRRAASERYPYGYDRAEDLAGLGVAPVIWGSVVFAGVESYRKLVGHGHTSSVYLGLAGAAIGIIANQAMARYELRVGRRIHSATLVADAKHSWLDALSSAGALVGLALVAAGFRWGDPVAGLAVTLFIVHVAWTVTGELLHHLMDGAEPADLQAASRATLDTPGIEAAVLRGRWAGRTFSVDIDAVVDPGLAVAQAEHLGRRVEAAVLRALPHVSSVRWSAHPPRAADGCDDLAGLRSHDEAAHSPEGVSTTGPAGSVSEV